MQIPIETPHPASSQSRLLLRCFGYLRPHWKLTVVAYSSMLAIDALNMISPQIIRWTIDKGILAGDFSLLALASAALLGLVIVKGVLSYFQGRCTEVASQNVAYDMRNELQRKITQLSFSFHDQAQAGDLLSRAIQDVERIRFLTGRATFRVVEGVVMMAATAVVMVVMNPRLSLLAVLAIPLLAFQSIRFGRIFRPLSRLIQEQLAALTTRVEQNLRGVRVVKTFAQEAQEIERFEVENQRWFELSSTSARLQAVHMPLLQWIANISSVAILLYGGMLVINGQMTIGELVAFNTYMGQLVTPVRFLGMILPAITMAAASAERIFEILDQVPEVYEQPDAPQLKVEQGCVRFENVSFSYGKNRVLREISFEAQPNQVVALLGLTGSGKTSIVNLIPRFYDPTEGRITIDGTDIRDVTLASLRAQIGMVLQETTLFEASIRDNIRFGHPDATEEEIVAAAQAAQAHEFILESAKGYDTEVGERGATLSGGQKQRLAIARALLTDPHILILDDATSSVDSETEYRIQLALEQVMRGRTTFVIAHRLSTVQRADLILVLEKGRIAARGRHAELLNSSPLYASICRQQLKG
ncbi:ABC-type multidrug transport system, ATPase and permease component [Longilinea arvoryzae]|uniref:ABC-type multidrug transport system, ATPase and permease component n=1 Tax=Longilinea arvoryzae TaxID=360412 RepID=A0A0S7B719_9CHLR|nr:ABC transporter ATP-binding protein [Longilinea arvoryzae]GAP13100.1 ABC-type multidrug transport system, ATPase and permease component [Longilinea arvoryzae]